MAHIPTRILVPIDFSAASDRALSMAKEGADGFGAEIHLIHVRAAVDDPAIDTAILDEVEQILTVSESKTRQALEQAGKHRGARVHAHIKRGSTPAASIVDAVSEYGCDLVMMGTHGRRGLKGLLFGSVAERVIQLSEIPVLTVRGKTPIPTEESGRKSKSRTGRGTFKGSKPSACGLAPCAKRSMR